MAFAIPFVPPEKFSFPEDPLLTKFFYYEVVEEEEIGRGSFASTYKACFKGETVAIKEFIRNKLDKTRKIFLKQSKILKSLNHPNHGDIILNRSNNFVFLRLKIY